MKKLEEIIEEINQLSNDTINTNLDDAKMYESFKNNTLDDNTKHIISQSDFDKKAEDVKKVAIAFITKKYDDITKQLDNNNTAYSEYDYEVAYYKTFEEYFNIILNEEKIEEINRYLKDKMNNFFEGYNKIYKD